MFVIDRSLTISSLIWVIIVPISIIKKIIRTNNIYIANNKINEGNNNNSRDKKSDSRVMQSFFFISTTWRIIVLSQDRKTPHMTSPLPPSSQTPNTSVTLLSALPGIILYMTVYLPSRPCTTPAVTRFSSHLIPRHPRSYPVDPRLPCHL